MGLIVALNSDLLINYLVHKAYEGLETNEETLAQSLHLISEVIKCVRKAYKHLENNESLLILSLIKILLDKDLDEQPLLIKEFNELTQLTIINSEKIEKVIENWINEFLNTDFTKLRNKYKIIKFVVENLVTHTNVIPKIICQIPELLAFRKLILIFINNFSEDKIIKAGFSEFQLNFMRRKPGETFENQKIDNWINASKESLRKSVAYKRPQMTTEELLKNPVLNQNVSAELFLADLKLLQNG